MAVPGPVAYGATCEIPNPGRREPGAGPKAIQPAPYAPGNRTMMVLRQAVNTTNDLGSGEAAGLVTLMMEPQQQKTADDQ
jgi:hypothetical protein